MLSRFLSFVRQKALFSENEQILLAVSGGIDSMVMLYLFEKSGFRFSVIHCNFQLRGDESDHDQKFLENYCIDHGMRLFKTRFETKDYARTKGISIEMAARELRYHYFEEIRSEYHFDYIATAHHLDDQIETFFLNLSRKTGLRGLTGMEEKAGRIIRPMLFASRNEIEEFAGENEIPYQEDSTNSDIAIQRNLIRHSVLPLLEQLNPALRRNIIQTIGNLKEAYNVYSAFLNPKIGEILKTDKKYEVVSIAALLKKQFPELILYEILSRFGFNSYVIKEIWSGLAAESGRQYYSATHRVVKDRDKLIITLRTLAEAGLNYIEDGDIELFSPVSISLENYQNTCFTIPTSQTTACIDKDLLEFPLIVRKWEPGDFFQPFGMKGLKKISDFLIDEKVSRPEKENTWLVVSGQKVVWIVGKRIDNRFRIRTDTKNILVMKIRELA